MVTAGSSAFNRKTAAKINCGPLLPCVPALHGILDVADTESRLGKSAARSAEGIGSAVSSEQVGSRPTVMPHFAGAQTYRKSKLYHGVIALH